MREPTDITIQSRIARFLAAPPSDDVDEIDAEFQAILGELDACSACPACGSLQWQGDCDCEASDAA